jgi:selenocysteine lyase/cysteine desulfurase
MVIFGTEAVGRSVIEGGTGINSMELNMPDVLPEAYEAGTMSTPLIAGLCESVKWLKAVEQSKILRYEEELYEYIKALLETNEKIEIYCDSNSRGNTLLFNVNGLTSTELSNQLDMRGICTRSGLHCAPLAHKTLNVPSHGAVRIGIGVFNTKAELNTLFDAVSDIIKSRT